MENYETTNVYKFLNDQYEYLTGDLKVFHGICEEAERNETYSTTSSQLTSSVSQPRSISPTTTTETTRNPSDNIKFYRLTIPVTLSLFATIDSLGFLSGDNERPQDTEKNFKEFFSQSPIHVSNKDAELIIYVFRQGLSHVYFPKLNLGISYHSKNPDSKLILKSSNGYLTLNVNMLEKIVVNTFEEIKEKRELYQKMERKYQDLINKYQEKDGDKISNYESES
jgi:hypothetical protein